MWLGDVDIGGSGALVPLYLPVRYAVYVVPFFLVGFLQWLALLVDVIDLSVNQKHYVGILFDIAGYAQIPQLRTFIVTTFNGPVQLA